MSNPSMSNPTNKATAHRVEIRNARDFNVLYTALTEFVSNQEANRDEADGELPLAIRTQVDGALELILQLDGFFGG